MNPVTIALTTTTLLIALYLMRKVQRWTSRWLPRSVWLGRCTPYGHMQAGLSNRWKTVFTLYQHNSNRPWMIQCNTSSERKHAYSKHKVVVGTAHLLQIVKLKWPLQDQALCVCVCCSSKLALARYCTSKLFSEEIACLKIKGNSINWMMSHRLLNMSKSLAPQSDTTQPKNTMSDNKYKCFAIFGKKLLFLMYERQKSWRGTDSNAPIFEKPHLLEPLELMDPPDSQYSKGTS